jgi:type II secretory pathway component GspD/PulD (secretin)
MPNLRLSVAAVLLISLPGLHAADAPAPAAPEEISAAPLGPDEEMARLQALPPSHIPLKGATLSSALRLLAQAAHMSYLSPPEAEFSERVTSDVRMNPYALIQILAENYNFASDYRGGVWQFYRINLNELVSKSYTLRFNNMQQVSITSSGINSQLAAMGSMTNGSSGSSGSSYSSSSGGGKSAFSVKADKIIDDIRKILSVPTVGLETLSLEGSSAVPGIGAARKAVDAPKIEPIWNPDTSQLFVVATRQQHSLIASYLKTVDQPQKLIRISVKFIETARNPTQALGVDWSNTFLGSGGPISLSGVTSVTKDPVTGGLDAVGTSSTALTSVFDPSHAASTLKLPPLALLSAPAFQWTVQAIATDKMSSIVQDPVIYTSNNREVTFKATSQQPIQEGTTTIGSATAATTSQIAYIDVGTEVTILPCILPGGGLNKELVQLNLSINVSSIIGQQVINGNSYPITSSRTYAYSVAIPNGQTLAIAGLEERSRQTTDNKIPIFGDLPLIGYAFKNKSDSIVHTTLLAFITPELIQTDSATAGEAAVVPAFRHRLFQGAKDESLTQLVKSLEGMPEDISALQASANRLNKDSVLNRLGQIDVELALIDVRLGELKLAKDRLTAPAALQAEQVRRQLDTARQGVERIRVGDRAES